MDDGNRVSADAPFWWTSLPQLHTFTLSSADALWLKGVREGALAVARTPWSDAAGRRTAQLGESQNYFVTMGTQNPDNSCTPNFAMVEIRAADRPVPPPSIKTPVLQLASGGLVSKMEALDQSELHTVNKWGGALHYAVSNDHAAAARWLLERGVAVDGRTCNGHTALHIAAHFGHGTLVGVLLTSSASPDAVDKQGRAPLHFAAAERKADVCAALLARGAAADLADKHHNSALAYAQRAAATAMGVARQRESLRTVKVLEEAARAVQRWFSAARHADLARLSQLLAAGQPPPQPHHLLEARRHGSTALHDAARRGVLTTLAWLLEAGADPHSRTVPGGETPLHLAVRHALLPLSHALAGGSSGEGACTAVGLALAERLLAHGAPPLAADAQGHTALALLSARLGAAHPSEAPALGRGLSSGLSSGLSWRERSEAGEAHGDGAGGGSIYTALLKLGARLERAELLRRRLRLFVRVAGCAAPWHARARERAYAPGGLGFHEVRTDFEERARKAQRCAEG